MTESGAQAEDRPVPGRVPRGWLGPRVEVALLVLLAAVVRLAAWQFRFAITNDSVDLLRDAERVAAEGWHALLTSYTHPLPVLLLSWVPAGADPEVWGSAGAALLSALAVWPLHIVARTVAGRHAATVACLAYAVLPKFVATSSVPLGEPVFLPLLAAAFAMALTAGFARTPARRIVRCVLAGLFAGLSYLARPEGLAIAAAVTLAVAMRSRRGERLRSSLIVAAAFALVAGPWVAELSSARGHLVLSPKKEILDFVGATSAPHDGKPGPSLATAVQELAGALWSTLSVTSVLILVGAFAPVRWRRRRARAGRWILVFTAAGLCALVVRIHTGWDYGTARHTLAACLLLLPFAGEGLAVVVGFFGRAVHRRRAALLVAMLMAIPSAVFAMLRPDRESGERARLLGEQIAMVERERGGGGGDIAIATFGQPLVAYYADRELRAAPADGPPGTVRRVRDVRLFRQFRYLLETSPDREGLRAELAAKLRADGASWLVLEFWDRPVTKGLRGPGEELAQFLVDDKTVGTPVVGAGELAAFPVLR